MSTPPSASSQPDVPPPPPPATEVPADENIHPPAPQSSTRWKVAGISSLVVVALVLTAGFFFLGHQAAHAPRVAPPKLSKTTEVPNLGGNIELKPVSPDLPLLINGGTLLARISDGKNESLISVDVEGDSAYPRWQVPIPDDLTGQALDCAASGGLVDCGEHLRIDVEKGVNTVSESVFVSAGLNEGGEATEESESEETQSQSQGAAQSGGGAQSGGNIANTRGSVQVLAHATEQMPLTIDGGKSLNADGEKLPNLFFDPATTWAKKVSVPRRIFGAPIPIKQDGWIVSDGVTVAHIVDKEIRWSIQLPQGSVALNGFTANGVPKWVVDNEDFILATPDSIKAFDTLTGEIVWDVKGKVDSWIPTGGGIVLSSGSTISLITLDQTGENAQQSGPVLAEVPGSQSALAQAQSAQSGDEAASGQSGRVSAEETPRNVHSANDGGGQQKPAPWTGSTGGLDLAAFQNAKLEVPEDCSVVALDRNGPPIAEFVNGEATGTRYDVQPAPTATMREIVPALFDGQPVILTVLRCFGGGNTAYEVMGVYDKDFKLLYGDGTDFNSMIGRNANFQRQGLRTVGNTVIFEAPNLLVAGDESCSACRGSATATVVLEWSDGKLHMAGMRYDISGQTVQVPTLEEVQKIYDALVAQDQEVLEQSVDPEVTRAFHETTAGAPMTRAAVTRCVLAGPGHISRSDAVVRQLVNPGEVLCGLQMRDEKGNPLHPPGREDYVFGWLILTANQGEPLRVVDVGFLRD